MSDWDVYGLEVKIKNILKSIECGGDLNHHFGAPFATSYQIAIEFKGRYPKEFKKMGYDIGGKGSGVGISLSQYIANELSRRIKSGEIKDIEGGFFSGDYLKELVFNDDGSDIVSSVEDVSIYRLK